MDYELPEGFPLSADEQRIVGALIEKSMTTPENYPLSLNAVKTACNQVSNRDPVVNLDETYVEQMLRQLADQGIVNLYHRPGDRVVKYIHTLDRVLDVNPAQLSLLSVLLLRGAQTPGELRQRTHRYGTIESLAHVDGELSQMSSAIPPLVIRLERQPGQKEDRYEHRLGGVDPSGGPDRHEPPHQQPVEQNDSPHEPVAHSVATTTAAETRSEMTDNGLLVNRVNELERKLDALLKMLDVDEI